MNSQLERIFMKVQKPGRYTGGELNSVVKDPAAVDFRFAFCFPDLYEVGMSHLGMKILVFFIQSGRKHVVRAGFCAGHGYGSDDAQRGHPAVWAGKP